MRPRAPLGPIAANAVSSFVRVPASSTSSRTPKVRAAACISGTNGALAGLAGVVGAPILNLYPGLDSDILILALVVVVVGGLGTLEGAFFGSLIIGLADTLGKAFVPEFARFLLFGVMAIILLVRPAGLFGLKESQ